VRTAAAVYFGEAGRELFGWLHRPAGPEKRALGLVICNPFGNESLCAHRSLRHFAQEAAAAGIAAMRFDYHGTGDSMGDDQDPDRVRAWLASIRAAVQFMRSETAGDRIALLGVRLGATLAGVAAMELGDIEAMIAIAPVVSARAYLRELRALQLAMDARRGIERKNDGNLESGGFELTSQTQTDLAAIDLTRLTGPVAANVLIIDRDDLPGADSWAAHLARSGTTVDRRRLAGYSEMMLDSHESVVPQAMVQATTDWLRQIAGESRAPLAIKHASESSVVQSLTRVRLPSVRSAEQPPASSLQTEIEERAVRFGTAPLFGVVSAPVDESARNGHAILLLNSGAVTHVGPSRLHVTLARRWARTGHVVLRFDFSGIGDSPPRAGQSENVVYSAHATQEVREATDYLQDEWRSTAVHSAGVCSGGYHSFKAAVDRVPLKSVVLINPLTFFWHQGISLAMPEYRVAAEMMRYRTKVLRIESWLKLLRGGVDLRELSHVLLQRARAQTRKRLRALARIAGVRLEQDLQAELEAVANGGTHLHFLFSAGEPGIALLRDQGGAATRRLEREGKLDVEFIDGADHTFTDRAARAALTTALAERLDDPQGRLWRR
jgi:alpha-beta hydrolase superfamily lysophospholipase